MFLILAWLGGVHRALARSWVNKISNVVRPETAFKYYSAAAKGNAEWGIGYSFQLASLWDQFALHALTNCHLCKNRDQAQRLPK